MPADLRAPLERLKADRAEAFRKYYREPHESDYVKGLRWGTLVTLDNVIALLALPAETPAPETPPANAPKCGKQMRMRGVPTITCDLRAGHGTHEGIHDGVRWWFNETGAGIVAAKGPETPADPPPARHD
jgi:hypothetical protein